MNMELLEMIGQAALHRLVKHVPILSYINGPGTTLKIKEASYREAIAVDGIAVVLDRIYGTALKFDKFITEAFVSDIKFDWAIKSLSEALCGLVQYSSEQFDVYSKPVHSVAGAKYTLLRAMSHKQGIGEGGIARFTIRPDSIDSVVLVVTPNDEAIILGQDTNVINGLHRNCLVSQILTKSFACHKTGLNFVSCASPQTVSFTRNSTGRLQTWQTNGLLTLGLSFEQTMENEVVFDNLRFHILCGMGADVRNGLRFIFEKQ